MGEALPGASPAGAELSLQHHAGSDDAPQAPENTYKPQPLVRSHIESYAVKDELVLLPPGSPTVYALNRTGAAIWKLCDGNHTLEGMFTRLREEFSGADLQIMADLNAALLQFRELDLLEPASLADAHDRNHATAVDSDRPRVRIVHGVEDNPYFHWQLAILFESLVGQMPSGWDVNIVVCNNHGPISPDLEKILTTYGVTYYTGNSPADNHDIDFAGGGDRYAPMNRVEALSVAARHAAPQDMLCLMDTDIFLFGELQEDLFPRGNAMASNWIIGQERYFHFSTQDQRGLSLPKLLDAFGCEQEFKPGGVMVFLTAESVKKNDYKLVRDCFRFLQILYLSGKILDLPDHGVWVSEMACFALAMYPNDLDYELLDIEQFAVQDQNADSLAQGSFFHYYSDINDDVPGPFVNSRWHKQLFRDQNFLLSNLDSFLSEESGEAERAFIAYAERARDRIYGHDDE